MYAERNAETLSHNHFFFLGKEIRIIYFQCCVCVVLVIQHAERVRLIIVICGLSVPAICFSIIS